MRATFLCPTLAVGGAERMLSSLVVALIARGVDARVISINHRGRFYDELEAADVPVEFIGARSRYDLVALRRAYSSVRATLADVIVTQSINAHVVGHRAARTEAIPHVAIEHGSADLRTAAHRRALLRLVAPRVDAVIAVTASQESKLVSLGYVPEAIHVIPNGVSRPMPQRERSDTRADLGVGEGDVLALLVATLRPEKQAMRFVDAVVDARRSDGRVRGIVVGSGPELEAVRQRVAAEDGVIALGHRGDVADLMVAADLICLSSRAEALPMVLLEAMALGRPVVATSVGGIPEVVTPDVGILVDPDSTAAFAEALCLLAKDPDRRRQMGIAGLGRYADGFTLDRTADRYLALLTTVIEAHCGAGNRAARIPNVPRGV